MPPAYTNSQRQQIAQFVTLTQAKDAVAAKYLKSHGWKVEEAIDAYFQGTQSQSGRSSVTVSSLNKIFDSYRDASAHNPDSIGIEGVMKYFSDIKIELDEVACFGIAELLKSPTMGEFTREGFVEGWKLVGCETLPKMASHASALRIRIISRADVFRRVYRYAFTLCRQAGQRNLSFEIASEQWQLFFSSKSGGINWNTTSTPWLDWWIEFLEGRSMKPVNKDLWEQTEVFMRKIQEDESLGWWTADGAWPGALDDFVLWVKAKRGKAAEAMEIE